MSISSHPQWVNNSKSKVISSSIPIQQFTQQKRTFPYSDQQTRQYTTVIRFQNNEISNNVHEQNFNFIDPQQMLRGLLSNQNHIHPFNSGSSTQYRSGDLNMNAHQQTQQQEYGIDRQQIVREIEKIEDQLNNMDNQVLEAQNMLNIRENLYQQLDNLRIQRQGIEEELQLIQQQDEFKKREKVQGKNKKDSKHIVVKEIKANGSVGLHEMNERLKRRILQVKQYIEKMSIQNERIEEAIFDAISNKKTEQQGYKKYSSLNNYYSQGKFYQNHNDYSFAKTNQYFEDMRRRLQNKQQEAWMKLRIQQDQIADRNRSTINRVSQMYPISQGRQNINSKFHTSYG